jgi:hypothetical protein
VPGSFLVNWFGNVTQMLNAITDFVGLTLDNQSVTTSVDGAGNWYQLDAPAPYTSGYSTSSWNARSCGRSIGSVPMPNFEFRLPNVDWGSAAIASSLAFQRVDAFASLGRG